MKAEFKLQFLAELTDDITSNNKTTEINNTTITRNLVSSLPASVRKQISNKTINYLQANEYDIGSYTDARPEIVEEIRLLQKEQFKYNTIAVYENLTEIAFNKKPMFPQKKDEVPEAFKENSIKIDTPFKGA